MKSIRQGINEYLEYRRKLGFKLRSVNYTLTSFASFIEENGAKHITTELAIDFATLNPKVTPTTWSIRLKIVRRFALYWSAIDPKTKIPPKNLLPYSYNRRRPHIYTDEEIKKILKCYESDFGNNNFEQHLYFTLFGLLAVTGMRVSEALSLDCDDVDLENGIITVRQSKFRKSRHIPIHRSTVNVLKNFKDYRNHYFSNLTSSRVFIDYQGKSLTDKRVHYVFHTRLLKIGLAKPDDGRKSYRLMDFRHTVAVKIVLRWYMQGVTSIDSLMPLLSTYLGHVKPTNTYWYLTATPELLKVIMSRREKYKKERTS